MHCDMMRRVARVSGRRTICGRSGRRLPPLALINTFPQFDSQVSRLSTRVSSSQFYRDGVDPNVSRKMCFTSTLDEDDPLSHEIYRYEVDFKAECADVQFTQEGAFIELEDDMEEIFPTGMAGELADEAFMVRDCSKLLCRLIEDFESRCKYGTGMNTPPAGHRFPVVVPDLTNLPQWDDADIKVYNYSNNNLNSVVGKPETDNGERMIVRGEGSVVEGIVKKLQEQNNGELPARVMLTGRRGVGKSCALNHAVYHARKRGWICLFIPNGYDHVNGGAFVEPVEEITGVPDLYDNMTMSADLLRQLWHAHKQDLRDIQLKCPEKVIKYKEYIDSLQEFITRTYGSAENSGKTFTELRHVEDGDEEFPEEDLLDGPILNDPEQFDISTFEIKTVEDLVLFGIAFRDFAGPVALDVINELRSYKNPDKPVLIAIDQFNYWDMPTVYQYGDMKIEPMNICVPHALKFVSEKKNAASKWEGNGDDHVMCIGATSHRFPINKMKKKKAKSLVTYENSRSSLPLSIEVGGYSHVEFLAALKYYISTGRIDPGISNQDILSFRMFCGNNPRTMYREPSNFFLPLQSDYVSTVYHKITAAGGGGGPETYKTIMRDEPQENSNVSLQDERYEACCDEEINAISAADCDVDLSSLNEAEVDNYMTNLTTEPVWDNIEMTDSNPLESKPGEVNITFGGRYDELLRTSGE